MSGSKVDLTWEMKVHVHVEGEIGACIPSWDEYFGIGIDRKDVVGEFRENIRQRISDVFSFIHDRKADVWFDDECPSCHEKLPSAGGPSSVPGCPERWHIEDGIRGETADSITVDEFQEYKRNKVEGKNDESFT